MFYRSFMGFRVKLEAECKGAGIELRIAGKWYPSSRRNIMKTLEATLDENGNQVVILPDIIFSGKQNIDWNEVEKYLERFVGEWAEIAEVGDIIYLGKDFPDEYAGSKYTRKMKGGRAKAKANAAQGIREMVGIATDKRFREN